MAKYPIWQVDAFASRLFAGNPAAVVVLPYWLGDKQLAAIAQENNLSETAYLVGAGDNTWELRWFTPAVEVPLCGHATLASAYVLQTELGFAPPFHFLTRSAGVLTVTATAQGLEMALPRRNLLPGGDPGKVENAIGIRVLETRLVPVAGDETILALVENESSLMTMRPDIAAVAALDARSLIVTAPADGGDFVSRFFAPRHGLDEDPVTGSAHCALAPYWAERLNKTEFQARQISRRGGELFCRLVDDIVYVSGNAVLYLAGEIRLGQSEIR
ncbi:PhzF family phenazine biosynthesis protein [Aureimonas fodinaquatilis]|uniref:PhzF family phenazine biosynthesis protein n=1 Tax=Aureimonas fodinaquatilis TaxID=2565783 RepID=A0A5B0E589_9HYPH|nr:PhzF family phenazine biosynthesis protein [Aureimonas fodinaquatilis]KAA0972599.1 PhzF family phenazine biosynthesis protein [Aureimonas fodinaquatilis]